MREFSCCWGWEKQQEEGSELGVPFCGALMVEQSGRHPRKEHPSKAPQPSPAWTWGAGGVKGRAVGHRARMWGASWTGDARGHPRVCSQAGGA